MELEITRHRYDDLARLESLAHKWNKSVKQTLQPFFPRARIPIGAGKNKTGSHVLPLPHGCQEVPEEIRIRLLPCIVQTVRKRTKIYTPKGSIKVTTHQNLGRKGAYIQVWCECLDTARYGETENPVSCSHCQR